MRFPILSLVYIAAVPRPSARAARLRALRRAPLAYLEARTRLEQALHESQLGISSARRARPVLRKPEVRNDRAQRRRALIEAFGAKKLPAFVREWKRQAVLRDIELQI